MFFFLKFAKKRKEGNNKENQIISIGVTQITQIKRSMLLRDGFVFTTKTNWYNSCWYCYDVTRSSAVFAVNNMILQINYVDWEVLEWQFYNFECTFSNCNRSPRGKKQQRKVEKEQKAKQQRIWVHVVVLVACCHHRTCVNWQFNAFDTHLPSDFNFDSSNHHADLRSLFHSFIQRCNCFFFSLSFKTQNQFYQSNFRCCCFVHTVQRHASDCVFTIRSLYVFYINLLFYRENHRFVINNANISTHMLNKMEGDIFNQKTKTEKKEV